ncbi:G-rich sequence factor 1 [Platichthys flesus]|uniref:G-rich sequence factor 1 n=1 Tax=Platichthys flesus TaxID=8260 RepID=UPI002DB88417|nr:G-rich sequence factor 1 [Platichthys flesus]
MSRRPLLLLLRSLAELRPGTLPGAATARAGFTQQRARSSTPLNGFLQRACPPLSAVKSTQLGLCTKAGPPCEDEYPPLPAYQSVSEPEKKEVFIVQVKGLPWSCSAQDLMHFFSECRIRDGLKGIHLTVDRLGRSSGRAFIELEHEEDVNKALEKHRQYLGPRYVEVSEVTNSDAEAILNKAVTAPAESWVVKLRGLPFSCCQEDIVHFFSGLDIAENGITVVTDHRGRNSGEAFVQFASQEAADGALQRDRDVIGNRYIEVFPSTSEEIHSSWRKKKGMSPGSAQSGAQPGSRNVSSAPTNHRTGSPPSSTALLHYIHMRGLPFQASGEDIVKFFSPLAVSRILIECGADGRRNGEAGVYFNSHQDAAEALTRNRQYIGERYVELFLNSASDSNGR